MADCVKISLIIPVYHVEDFILPCLESVARQTLTEGVECILVDDCGHDGSMQIVEDFVGQYKGDVRFIILHHEHNRGLSAARNTALAAATGEYVYFLDSDDYLFDHSFASLWQLVERHPHVDVVQGNLYSEDIESNLYAKGRFPEYSDNRKWIQSGFSRLRIPESACNRLVRRELLIENNLLFQEGWIQEDTLWSFSLHDYVRSIAFCFEPTYYYRKNTNSIMHSSGREKEALAFVRIANKVYRDYLGRTVRPYEVRFLEILAMRIERARDGRNLQDMEACELMLFRWITAINSAENRHLRSIPFRAACRCVAAPLRGLLCLKFKTA